MYAACPTELFVVLSVHAVTSVLEKMLVRRWFDCDMGRGDYLVTAVMEDSRVGNSESGRVW